MNSIHPTAIIGRNVRLGSGNSIGPYVVIGGSASLGDNNWIGTGVTIGCPPEVRSTTHSADWIDESGDLGVEIGNSNVFREASQVHGGWKRSTVLGDRLFVMNQVYIAHDCEISDDVTLASGVALGGHTKLGFAANLGLGTTVHQGIVIGALAMVGMSSVVTRCIPPFAKAYGNPARVQGVNSVGLSRAGVADQVIARIEVSATVDDDATISGFLAWYREALA